MDDLCAFMDENPRVGVAGPRVLWPDGLLQSSCRKFPGLWNKFCPAIGLDRLFPRVPWLSGEHMFYFAHDRRRDVNVLVGCLIMARREAIKEVGLLDERFFIYAEDVDWCRRFWQAGWSVTFCPDARATHKGRSSSSSDPGRFSAEQLRAGLQYWKKHHSAFKCRLFTGILLLHHGLRLTFLLLLRALKPSNRKTVDETIARRRSSIRWLLTHRLDETSPA